MTRRKACTALVVAVLGTGCSSSTITDVGGPVFLTLTADRATAQVGEGIEFTYDASGSSLNGLILAYGDGVVDSISFFGAQSGAGRRTHAYDTAGQFRVVGTVEDAIRGSAKQELTLQVTPAVPLR